MSIGSWKTEEVLSLKVTLRGFRPPIWRRLEVPSRLSLSALHDAIHAAMGWEGHHLYVSDVPRRRYGDPAPVDGVADDARLTVGGVLKSGVGRFSFGDDWVHEIVIEGMKVAAGGRRYPVSAAGKKNCQMSASHPLAISARAQNPSGREQSDRGASPPGGARDNGNRLRMNLKSATETTSEHQCCLKTARCG